MIHLDDDTIDELATHLVSNEVRVMESGLLRSVDDARATGAANVYVILLPHLFTPFEVRQSVRDIIKENGNTPPRTSKQRAEWFATVISSVRELIRSWM